MEKILDKANEVRVVVYFKGKDLIEIVKKHLLKKTGLELDVSIDLDLDYSFQNGNPGYYYVDINWWSLDDGEAEILEEHGYGSELGIAELTSVLFSEIFGDGVDTSPILTRYPDCEVELLDFPVIFTLQGCQLPTA